MVKRLWIPILVLLLFTLKLNAQSPSKTTGQINGADGKGINAATVILYKVKDSVPQKTTITNAKGNYEITIPKKGNYYITATSAGFTKASSAVFSINKSGEIIISSLVLEIDTSDMQAVFVKGNYIKPIIEVNAGKTVFNVENSINATGSNAFELLQKSPGVTTDKDDNITVKGKNGVRIYIDGRPTQMSNDDLPAYLKSVNSNDIQSIEIISNPSAQYDASGNAGIINIKLKKNDKQGFNGSVSLGLNYGKTFKTPEAFSFNYRNKKINIFANYSYDWGTRQENLYLYREQSDSIFNQYSLRKYTPTVNNIKTGVDYYISNRSTFGFIATVNLNKNVDASNGNTLIGPLKSNPIYKLLATNTIPGNVKNIDYNINYRFADTSGHVLSFDADHGFYNNNKMSVQTNYYYDIVPDSFLHSTIYNNTTAVAIDINTAKLDYSTPFKKGKLEIGGKISYVTTQNIYDFYNVNTDTNIRPRYSSKFDSSQSNWFNYKENVNAVYANYNRPINKQWTVQLGLRIENTSSNGQLTRYSPMTLPDDNVKRNYTDFFPTAAATYIANEDNTFNLSFSRRIDRPNYKYLNPFETKIDELTYEKGNAFLLPQYTNTVELTHTFKNKFNTTLSYSHVTNFSSQIIDTVGSSASYLTPENLASQDLINLNFSLPVKVNHWWNIYATANGYYSTYKGQIDKATININLTSYSLYLQQTFSFAKNYTAEITGYYDGPSVWQGTFKSSAIGGMDIGIQRKLFNKKADIKLSCSDLLNSMHWRGISNYNGAYINASGNWESHIVKLNFTYRFGNSQFKQAQHHTASEDENKRTGSAGGLGGN